MTNLAMLGKSRPGPNGLVIVDLRGYEGLGLAQGETLGITGPDGSTLYGVVAWSLCRSDDVYEVAIGPPFLIEAEVLSDE